jgi:cystinosin
MAAASVLSTVCGWVYFASWSASFYPQLALNYKHRSVRGLSLDFVLLNTTGFTAYALYTAILHFYTPAVSAFTAQHAIPPQVPLNDVVFGAHGAALCAVALVQCVIFPRGAQTVQPAVGLLCGASWLLMVLGFGLAATHVLPWLVYLDACGLVKVVCSFFKYVPQVVFNWQRKSTTGFAAAGMALDFTGGIFSISQQALTSHVVGSWAPFTRNAAKTSLAVETLVFDAVLLVQHFVLYSVDGGKGADGKKTDVEYGAVPLSSPKLKGGGDACVGSRSRSTTSVDALAS